MEMTDPSTLLPRTKGQATADSYGGRSRGLGMRNCLICRHFTGATGLEPATSGVTDHFSHCYMHDGRSETRLITSISSSSERARMAA
jgi:hypothetical protein